jgi:hypothetical protein
MKNRLTYEETELFMIKFLMQPNVIFKMDEKSTLPCPTFDIFINDRIYVYRVMNLHPIQYVMILPLDLWGNLSQIKHKKNADRHHLPYTTPSKPAHIYNLFLT